MDIDGRGADSRKLGIREVIYDGLGNDRRTVVQEIGEHRGHRQSLAGHVVNSNSGEVFAVSEPFDHPLQSAFGTLA